MLAMELRAPGTPLVPVERPVPTPGPGEILLQVLACGVCRTDLHIVDGELPPHGLPIVPGHEVVGRVAACGPGALRFAPGTRVGVPWLAGTCGYCGFCARGQENLCDAARFTGYDRDGGYAQYALADERYAFALPAGVDDVHAAPLLCAGLIGYRAYAMADTRPGERLGIYGFGAAAHIIAQLAIAEGREVCAFTRSGDTRGQAFARALGARWAGASEAQAPEPLDAALLFAPVGALVPLALRAVRKGGRVVCAGIHMSDIPGFPYADLWGERVLRSVANLTRADGEAFLAAVARHPVQTHTVAYPLSEANRALDDLRRGAFDGAAVLLPPRE